jgi:hypothetical protein
MRFTRQSVNAVLPNETADFSENYNNFEYIHPSGNKPNSRDNTIVLLGTYLSEKTVSMQFELFSQPAGAALILDGEVVIGDTRLPSRPCNPNPPNSTKMSRNFTLYQNKYHQIAIIHNAGCVEQHRIVSLKARVGNDLVFEPLNSSNIFTFNKTECREGFFGSTCTGKCSEDNPCNNNGRCEDGMSGTGECDCLRGYLGKYCNEICSAAKHCNGNGRCIGDGSCQCFAGYSGNDCSQYTDTNLGSRAGIAIVFYSICAAGFFSSTIFQCFKMENGNPIAHICLTVFSLMKLAASLIIKIHKSQTIVSNILSLLPVAILAFVILRSIVLIKNQFDITSPDFRFEFLHMSVLIVPFIIAVFAICGTILLPNHMQWSVALPFIICALYTFVFSIVALFCGMKEPYEKMQELFPSLAAELKSSRRYVVCASFFFIFDTFFAWYHTDTVTDLFGLEEYAYYALLITDIFTILCVGLANDAVLSDMFAVEGDDIGFVPTGFASVSDIDEEADLSSQLSASEMFAPLYSSCPEAYRNAEEIIKTKKTRYGKIIAKILICVLIAAIIAVIAVIIYVNPTYPVWSLDGMQFRGKDITLPQSVAQ